MRGYNLSMSNTSATNPAAPHTNSLFVGGIIDSATLPALIRAAGNQGSEGAKSEAAGAPPVPPTSITEHEVTINNANVKYRATAGTLPVRSSGEGKSKAQMFYVAYERLGIDDHAARPITFVFNGGPGSSSVWLHMGALGPKRVKLSEEGHPLPRRGEVIDNEYSWLDLTDLVFIDPVSTGLSRPTEGEDAKQFHSVEDDVKSVGEFIRLYTTRSKRWQSPKFLAGESYGSTRAAALAFHMQTQHGMYFDGVTLISPALDFQTLCFDHGNDLPYPLFLPTYAATAFQHGKLTEHAGKTIQDVIKRAEGFALKTYLPALSQGGRLGVEEKDQIAQELAILTGIDAATWIRMNLRINDGEFFKLLLRNQARMVGRLDTRFVCPVLARCESDINADPSYAAINGAFTQALHTHLLGTLNYTSEAKYEILYLGLEHWNFNASNKYVTTSPDLHKAMVDNPRLRVLICCGYFDAATPHFAAEFSAAHIGLDSEIHSRIKTKHFGAGHMMYIRHADLVQLKNDAAAFYLHD